MEINATTRIAANDSAVIANASIQNDHFKERRQREVQSDVKSQAVFYSPVIKIDRDTQAAVMQYRDTQTGEVKNEYPNKKAAKVYAHADATVEKPVVKAEVDTSVANDPVEADVKVEAKAETVKEPVASIDEDA